VRIVTRLLAVLALGVVVWVGVTAWPAVVHGHPAYAVLLALTVIVAIAAGVLSLRRGEAARGWRLALAVGAALLAVGWIAGMWWLRPFTAVEPALSAMESTATVVVTESPTAILMQPGLDPLDTGIVFQPGARVDARAYAAVLRPLVDSGHTVVIPKQPLGIAFLATGAFESARDAHPEISRWVVGGHSLGGAVASLDVEESADAQQRSGDQAAPVDGLLLYAAYPAADLSGLPIEVLSVSGTMDGLSTPADIEASRVDLPPGTRFVAIDGAVHAFFGDYGPQPGDGTPTVSRDEARAQIGRVSLEFLGSLEPR
jgi:hypothetical protein